MTQRIAKLHPKQIKAERIQTRADAIDTELVDAYATDIENGDLFPAIDIFTDGKLEWLAAGIHRLEAHTKLDRKIDVRYHRGTRQDALKYAFGSNEAHGKRPTARDKRYAVGKALAEFGDLSSRAIGEICHVSHNLVEKIRAESNGKSTGTNASRKKTTEKTSPVRVGRDGKARQEKPEKTPGKQKQDTRLWGEWDSAFGKLKRLTDDLNKEFYDKDSHAEVTELLNAAMAAKRLWEQGQ